MKNYGFTIVLKNVNELDENLAERIFACGADDSSPHSRNGTVNVAFDRDAESLELAVTSAVAELRAAGIEIERVELEEAELAILSN